jgi:hypothetical protein
MSLLVCDALELNPTPHGIRLKDECLVSKFFVMPAG